MEEITSCFSSPIEVEDSHSPAYQHLSKDSANTKIGGLVARANSSSLYSKRYRRLLVTIKMKSNAADPPIFNLVRSSPVPDDVWFIKMKCKIVKFQSIADLLTCLGNITYYIPEDPNFPCFYHWIWPWEEADHFVGTPDGHVTKTRRLCFWLSENL